MAADNIGLASQGVARRTGLGDLLGDSREMQVIYALIEKVSQHNFPVLILGESGTGKELVARAIHRLGARAHNCFTPVDCSALAPSLMESELFGHTKGSFTDAAYAAAGLFEVSRKGTIFLDEIGELPIPLQAKLLRAVQEGVVRPVGSTAQIPIDVRAIAATNRDLDAAILNGTFRQDLYFRLNVVQINMPSLRQRKNDIPRLANHFLEKFAGTHSRPESISEGAMRELSHYDWPGNVRELENAIQQAVALGSTSPIQASDLPLSVRSAGHGVSGSITDILHLGDLERLAIFQALQKTEGDRIAAARLLGIGKTTLYRKLKIWSQNAPMRCRCC